MKKKIAIFLPSANSNYKNLFFSIKKGFEFNNYEVFGGCNLLSAEKLIKFINKYNVYHIIEMNRTINQIPELKNKIFHISWMVDVADFKYSDLNYSNIIYFWGYNWFKNFKNNKFIGSSKFLPPAYCNFNFHYNEIPHQRNISFIGHIPNPWTNYEKYRYIEYKNKKISFVKLSKIIEPILLKKNLKYYDNSKYLKLAENILLKYFNYQTNIDNKKFKYDISCRLIRLINRNKMMSPIINHKNIDLEIFGPENWKKYKKYKKYYKSYLSTPSSITKIIQSSYINLHEGVALHDRLFNIMGSGGFLFYLKSDDDNSKGGINNYFDENKDYIGYNNEDFADKYLFYLKNPNLRKKIIKSAYINVNKNHTWIKRAKEIINDINKY